MTKLSDIQRQFILHWGEMGTRWGINRTVAQVDALLFISDRPLNAEEIEETVRDAVKDAVKQVVKEVVGAGAK